MILSKLTPYPHLQSLCKFCHALQARMLERYASEILLHMLCDPQPIVCIVIWFELPA